ncbi:MAG: type I DNA topoisomerase [Rhodospirillaceae bacterium]|nr:type I DNA topoisomerase [Rhodospirillaceae bacterium]
MAANTLVIVESPAKAKTINKYLGPDYQVLASYGHVRDLPPRDGSVRPDEDFAMDWAVADRSKKHMSEIAKAAKSAQRVLLATDPDREGEAISWHVQELLSDKSRLKDVDIKRITFNEITRSAVLDAIAHPRDVNRELVEAYLARRALDYLVGFTLSPVLWRKLPGSRSAGRVQSVALRLIAEREAEIESFTAREYWTIEALLRSTAGADVSARLTHLDGRKLDKFDIGSETDARAIADRLAPLSYAVRSLETKEVRRRPAPPFTTSTLQQEASRKLGFGATQTMRTAQKLYEGVDLGGETVGLITYMRTDGLQLAGEAVTAVRQVIGSGYGEAYLPAKPIPYKSAQKNAQEAHEAIRPTDPKRRPDQLAHVLDRDMLRLYDLIWKRTIACQMAPAVLDQMTVDIASDDGAAVLRATGSVVKFDGFLRVYEEGRDDTGDDKGEDGRLPPLATGEAMDARKIDPIQHFTQPPPRYTEASLVKRLEELGIGRPSTYASILQVLQDRDYVRLEKRRFVPEDRGRLVTTFLTAFFRRYVEYDFTAQMEEQLDDISGGRIDWRTVLRNFWTEFSAAVSGTKDLTISAVIDVIDQALGPHFFPPKADGTDPRHCPACKAGRLGIKFARSGGFIGCSNYPECRFTRPLEVPNGNGEGEAATQLPRLLGDHPETGEPISVRSGPYGLYVQLGEGGDGAKPKRASLPPGSDPNTVTLEQAVAALALPRTVGHHPETGDPIEANVGRFGPYLKYQNRFWSLGSDEDVLTIGMNRAVELLSPLRVLGDHPDGGGEIVIYQGPQRPFILFGKTKVTLPKGTEYAELTVEEAVRLIAAREANGGGRGGGRGAKGKKAAAAKPGKSAKSGKAATAKSDAKKTTEKDAKPAKAKTAKKTGTAKTATAKAGAAKATAKTATAKPAAARAKTAKS